MCLILDANRYSDFLDPDNPDMKPVHNWLARKNGRIVYAPTAKMEKELRGHRKMRNRFLEYTRSGKIKQVDKEKVNRAEKELCDLKSDDSHVVALAVAAKVKLLISNDRDLHEDFKKHTGGHIYQDKTHEHLLVWDTCP